MNKFVWMCVFVRMHGFLAKIYSFDSNQLQTF